MAGEVLLSWSVRRWTTIWVDGGLMLGKPCRHFRPEVDVKFLGRFLEMYKVEVLNVAGPRASNAPGSPSM